MTSGGLAILQRKRTVHSENRTAHNENRLAHNEDRTARNEKHHNIRHFSPKSRFSSNVVMVWKPPPTTTKVSVPIVVVLKNVLCRGLGLAALADRVDHDVQ